MADTPHIEPVPHEPTRYWVRSATRAELQHLVDLDDGGRARCSCEDSMVRDRPCKHVLAVLRHLETRGQIYIP